MSAQRWRSTWERSKRIGSSLSHGAPAAPRPTWRSSWSRRRRRRWSRLSRTVGTRATRVSPRWPRTPRAGSVSCCASRRTWSTASICGRDRFDYRARDIRHRKEFMTYREKADGKATVVTDISTAPAVRGEIDPATIDEIVRANGEPEWFAERRRQAWEVYRETPMPTTKDEAWRYTDLSKIPWQELAMRDPAAPRPVARREDVPAEILEAVP